MRRCLELIAQLLLLLGLVSCSGGGGDAGHAPAVTNLRFTPAAATQATGSTASIAVLADFSDEGGDVASVRFTSSSGEDVTVPMSALAGSARGTVSVPFDVSLDRAGKYTFEVWLVDAQGSASNRLSGAYEVLPRDTAYHPPIVSALQYAPATAVRVANGTATVNASVAFTDAGADVVVLRLTTSAGGDLSVPLAALNGLTSGTALATFSVPTDAAGTHTFEVWLVDSHGTASDHLSGSFDVLLSDADFHPPSITNLTYLPTQVLQSTGGVAELNFSVAFTDAGADVTHARVSTSTGAQLTLPTWMTGSSSAAASFAVPLTTVGTYTFDVWLVDRQGSVSNRLSGTYEVLPPGAAGTWPVLSVTPPAELMGIAWGAGQYVAVGQQGTVMTSPDLATWAVRSSGVTHTLRSVAMSASRIVAVGDSTAGEAVVISSADGANWSTPYNSSQCVGSACASPTQLSRVIWTGAQFVAVGMERPVGSAMVYALVLTSPDGITWTKRSPLALPISNDWVHPNQRWVTSIAWSGSVFAMLTVDVDWEPVVWTSADAEHWTLSRDLTNDAVWSMPLRDVTWGNGRFVAVDVMASDGNAPVFNSVDGVRWLPDTTAANLPTMNAVTSSPGEFVAVGDIYLQTSQDGLAWTLTPLSGCGNGVLWDGARYVAVGRSICKSR